MPVTVIESLITKLSFKADISALDRFEKTVSSIEKTLKIVSKTFDAITGTIDKFVIDIVEANDKTGKLSRQLGVDIGALQELGYVAELNGGSIDSMNSTLSNLSKITSEAARGIGSGVEVFGMLGLSATTASGKIKSADQMLLDISDSISKLGTQSEKVEFASKLGIGQDILLSIQDGSEAIIAQRKEAEKLGFVIGKEGAEAAADFNDSMLRVSKILQGVYNSIASKVLKVLNPTINLFNDWFKANQKIISSRINQVLEILMNVISGIFNITVRVFNTINGLVQIFGGWENVIKMVTASLIALNASALFIPIVITAIAAGIFLLIEDIVKFAQGGDSAIGNLIERFPALEGPINGIIALLKKIGEGWTLIFTQGDEALEGFIMMIKDVIGWLDGLWERIKGIGTSLINDLIGPLNKGIELLNKIPGVNIGDIGKFGQDVNPSPMAAIGSSQNIMTNTTTNNTSKPNINIKVEGGNPADVKKVITEVLNEQYAGAVTNLGSEVDF